MKRKLVIALGVAALLLGFNISIKPGEFKALAQAGVCQFAGYGPGGGLINTTVTCVTPIASGAGVITVKATATACGAVVQPSPTAGAVVVQVPVCPTAAPQNTASPSATSTSTAGAPSCVWSGSFPYTLGCNFPAGAAQSTPSPTATSTSTAGAPSFVISGSFPYTYTVNFPAASTCSNCLLKGTTGVFDTDVLAQASVTHFYKMNDTAGCTTVADAIAGGATAVPSAVPLPTPTTASTIVCGAPSISNDGEKSVSFPGIAASGYLIAPQSIWPASGNFTIGILGKLTAQGAGSVTGATQGTYWTVDTGTKLALFQSIYNGGSAGTVGTDALDLNATVVSTIDYGFAPVPSFMKFAILGTERRSISTSTAICFTVRPRTLQDSGAANGAIGEFIGGSPLKQPAMGRLRRSSSSPTRRFLRRRLKRSRRT